MNCKVCGAKIDDDSLFCKHCGSRVPGVTETSNEEKVRYVDSYFQKLSGFSLNEVGRSRMAKAIREFSLREVIEALDIASQQYFQRDASGAVVQESAGKAICSIGGICFRRREEASKPYIGFSHHVARIIENAFNVTDYEKRHMEANLAEFFRLHYERKDDCVSIEETMIEDIRRMNYKTHAYEYIHNSLDDLRKEAYGDGDGR
jgi:hypothetical protein